jgi:release factor glutamine methyltransferase
VLEDLVTRRLEGEPLAWLTGATIFCGLRVSVIAGVYVPRPQTEALARRAASLLPADGVAVDLCTGSGAIALVMKDAAPSARVVATELDPRAVACARANGVEVLEGSLDDALPAELRSAVDVIVSVPPYVPTDAIRLLPRDVRRFEPRAALDGGADGTDLLRAVAVRSVGWLRPGGSLLLELGGDQASVLAPTVRELGFGRPEVLADDEGDPRGMVARWLGP